MSITIYSHTNLQDELPEYRDREKIYDDLEKVSFSSHSLAVISVATTVVVVASVVFMSITASLVTSLLLAGGTYLCLNAARVHFLEFTREMREVEQTRVAEAVKKALKSKTSDISITIDENGLSKRLAGFLFGKRYSSLRNEIISSKFWDIVYRDDYKIEEWLQDIDKGKFFLSLLDEIGADHFEDILIHTLQDSPPEKKTLYTSGYVLDYKYYGYKSAGEVKVLKVLRNPFKFFDKLDRVIFRGELDNGTLQWTSISPIKLYYQNLGKPPSVLFS